MAYDNYGPCLKCKKSTSHASGVCAVCRQIKCKICGRVFTPSNKRHTFKPTCGRCPKEVLYDFKRTRLIERVNNSTAILPEFAT